MTSSTADPVSETETTPDIAPAHSLREMEAAQVWGQISEHLAEMIGQHAFTKFFTNAEIEDIDDTRIQISVSNDMQQLWIETNYHDQVTSAVQNALGHPLHVSISVQDAQKNLQLKLEASATDQDLDGFEIDENLPDHDGDKLKRRIERAGLNTDFSFEKFVVGQHCQFAHAACEAVAKQRGSLYNPLFLYGGSGLGKTHLMHAIGQQRLASGEQGRVIYRTCEQFTNEYIEAVRKGDIEKFRGRFRGADVLLIDDIQFLAGKERSQEEFFHTFNTLLDGKAQIVLTSDRPANEIKTLAPRLVSRFEAGMTVELLSPSLETRMAILERKREGWKISLDQGVLRFIAERIKSNIRRLEGAMVRLGTYVSLSGGKLDEAQIEYLLRDILREEATRQVSIDDIQKSVADHFEIRLADMTSRRRPANIAFARQVAMYLSRELTKSSLVEIGDAFGGRDHGTVIHAHKRVRELIDGEKGLKETLGMLQCQLER